jgi:putative peptidoglycan lipid II flippase
VSSDDPTAEGPRPQQPSAPVAPLEPEPVPAAGPTATPAAADLQDAADGTARPRRGVALNTLIFSVATGLSRIAGLAREVLASSYFGTSGAFSAFTLAFQIPNLVRSLFADAALSAAFVPVFTELLEKGRKKDAFQLASTLFVVMLAALGAITVLFMLAAGLIMPIFTGDKFDQHLTDLTVGLSRVLFPIVLLLGLNGLFVGILNAYDHFTVPALSPLVWNLVIMTVLVGLHPVFHGDHAMYAYALGVLAGTAVQLAMALPVLKAVDFRLARAIDLRDPRLKQVMLLMFPVTIGLGVINLDLLVNSVLGAFVSDQAPRAIDAAFRIYMLPQGMFSVAISTVLFPALSRFAARQDLDGLRALLGNGLRQICLMLIPAAAATLVLAEPITRLVFQRGHFDAHSTALVSSALFWFSFSLPLNGVNLLLTRTFFSLQRPWETTKLAVANVAVDIVVSVALFKPLGIPGIVLGTTAGNVVMAYAQARRLRPLLHGRIEGRASADAVARMLVAAAALGGASYGVWWALDQALGRSLAAQIISVGGGLAVGGAVYTGLVLLLRIHEARQIIGVVSRRLRPSA